MPQRPGTSLKRSRKVSGKNVPAHSPSAGPAIVVLILFVWSFRLTLGTALIIHPHLGRAIVASSGPTPNDFATALYTAAGSVSILGGSDFVPKTAACRILFVLIPSSASRPSRSRSPI